MSSKIPKNKLIVVPCSLRVPEDCFEIMQPLDTAGLFTFAHLPCGAAYG